MRRSMLLAAAVAAVVVVSDARASVTTASWVAPGSGNWAVASNWSTNPNYPNNNTPAGTAYQATIDLPSAARYTVTLSGINVAVDSLTLASSNATLRQSSGTATYSGITLSSGTYQLTGGTVSGGSAGGTVALSPTGTFTASGGRLDHLTFTGGDLSPSGFGLTITNGLSLSGNHLNDNHFTSLYFDGASQTFDDPITGSGRIYAGGTLAQFGGVTPTLTLGSHSSVTGSFGLSGYLPTASIINNGTLAANAHGQDIGVSNANFTNNGTVSASNGSTLSITPATWTNAATGSISADASVLTLGGSWTNAGSISATNASTFNLGGTWTGTGPISVSGASTLNLTGTLSATSLPHITVSPDSTVNLSGMLVNNNGPLAFSPTAAPWNLAGGTISGGTLSSTANLHIANGTFAGVTILAGTTVDVPTGSSLTMSGAFSNKGTINPLAGSTLTLAGSLLTPSIGTITPAPGAPVNIAGTLTNTGTTLSLPFTPNLISQGRIVNGTVASDLYVNGGQLFGTTIAPSATVTAAGALFYGNWSNHGTVVVPAGGSLNLSGSFTTAAIGNVSAAPTGTVYISGALDNTGATLNNPSGHWTLNSGTISGGTIGSDLAVTYGTFTNTSVAPGATLSSSYSQDAWFNGSWTNAGTITADSSIYNLNGTWSNTGTLSFSNSAATTNTGADLQGTWSNTGTLSVSDLAFVTLMGNWNNTGLISLSNHGNLTLTGTITPAQLGRITATPDSTLTIAGSLVMTPAETFSTTGNLRIDIGSVTGGTIALAPGQSINVAPAATFNGVRITGGDITTTPDLSIGGAVTFTNGLDLGGHAVNVNNNSSIGFNGPQTVDHTTINLRGGGHACGLFTNTYNPGDAITFGPDATVTTVAYASISGGAIFNNGTIRAQAITAAPTLQINNTSLVNNNRLEAVNGAKIQVSAATTLVNTGTISVSGAGATLDLQSTNWSNTVGATIRLSPGTTLILRSDGGTNAGTLSLDNATLAGPGALTNTGTLTGTGTLSAPLSNQGTLLVGDDTLSLASSLTLSPTASVLLSPASTLLLARTPVSQLRTYLASHQLAATTPDPVHSLAYTTSDTGLLVHLTLTGDANLDGALNVDDYALLDRGFNTGGSTWWQGDFNYDGQITSADYLAIDSTYLTLHTSAAASLLSQRESQFGPDYVAALVATLPEPASPLVLLMTGCWLTAIPPRRARRR